MGLLHGQGEVQGTQDACTRPYSMDKHGGNRHVRLCSMSFIINNLSVLRPHMIHTSSLQQTSVPAPLWTAGASARALARCPAHAPSDRRCSAPESSSQRRARDDHVNRQNGAMSKEEEEEEIGVLDVAEEVDIHQVSDVSSEKNDEGDRSLQERAEKYNLSAINVRSIIHVCVHHWNETH